MTVPELEIRLRQEEDVFVERKTSTAHDDVVQTLVAFANTQHQPEAVLFLGVQPDGTVVGLENIEKAQQSVAKWAGECYPAIGYQAVVLDRVGPRPVLAVVVPTSSTRPHFAGAAWVRVGSRSERATEKMLDELIASRNTKAGMILRHKGQVVTVVKVERWLATWNAPQKDLPLQFDGKIISCSAHSVEIEGVSSGRTESYPLERVMLTQDPVQHRELMLTIEPQ